jgi:RNA polymerase sigma factor (sigma-70 family)
MTKGQGEAPSDAELIASIKDPGSDAAAEELYGRHHSAVFSYAVACCRDPHTAEDLTSEAFARSLRAIRSDSALKAAWRPYLLTGVRRTAAEWADTPRRTGLSPEFEEWLANLPDGPESGSVEERMLRLEDDSLVLRAFRSLPERWQTVLWHTAVEGESAGSVGLLLGMGESGVDSLVSRAREGLRDAYLAAHAEDSGAAECRHYSSMLGAVVRRTGSRRAEAFDRHLSQCTRCTGALTELADLADLAERLGSTLSAGVLLWGSSAYMAAVAARATDAGVTADAAVTVPGPPGSSASVDGSRRWRPWAAGSPLRSAAVAGGVVVAIGLTALLLPMPFDDQGTVASPQQADSAQRRTIFPDQPPATGTARPPESKSSRPAKPPATASRTPSTTPSPKPSRTPSRRAPSNDLALVGGRAPAWPVETRTYIRTYTALARQSATASSIAPGPFVAPNVIDSRDATCWSSAAGPANRTEWIMIDLGATQPIRRVVLTPRQDGWGFPIDFTIQTSNDGTNFADVPSLQLTGFNNPGSTDVPLAFPAPVQARFVRVLATKLSNDDYGTPYFQLAEVSPQT